jgi:hypothetical protein
MLCTLVIEFESPYCNRDFRLSLTLCVLSLPVAFLTLCVLSLPVGLQIKTSNTSVSKSSSKAAWEILLNVQALIGPSYLLAYRLVLSNIKSSQQQDAAASDLI